MEAKKIFRIIQSIIYTIIDASRAWSNSFIDAHSVDYNGRKVFVSDYTVPQNTMVYFHFTSIPNKAMIGYGALVADSSNDYVLYKDGTNYSRYRSYGTQGAVSNTVYDFRTTSDLGMKKLYTSGNNQCHVYRDSSYIDYWVCGNSYNKIRVDKWANDDYIIDVYIL